MVQVIFSENSVKYDRNAFYQYDYGRSIIIHGLELPASVQVHFARKNAPAEIVIGTTVDNITTVRVPASTLQHPGEFNVYIFVADEETGHTYKAITFYTIPREKPADYAPPDEPNVVQQLMDRLDRIIETGIADYEPNINTVNNMIDAYVKNYMLANNLITNLPGFAMDARQGPVIQAKFDTINNKLGDWTFYASITQINASFSEATLIETIILAMPDRSVLHWTVPGTPNTDVYPTTGGGHLIIEKPSIHRISCRFNRTWNGGNQIPEFYIGAARQASTPIFSGWKKIALAD